MGLLMCCRGAVASEADTCLGVSMTVGLEGSAQPEPATPLQINQWPNEVQGAASWRVC
jgi:hypothetical protein